MKKILLFITIILGLSSLPLLAQGVNLNRYITLTVQSGKDIRLNFRATQANTPVRIVSGTNTQDITVGTDWFVDYSYDNVNYTVTSDGTTMTIYGDIVDFNCSYNRENLTSLDVSKNTQLAKLDCSDNGLTSLDVSKNTMLTELHCNVNELTSLDVSKNTQLAKLNCNDNELTSLDVSKNTQLTELYCGGNDLTSLDVSKNTQLATLYCDWNQLTSLDVSKNTQLTYLSCGHNQLTSLDVSKNTQLAYLECHGNKFTTESMNELYCSLPDRQEQNKGVIRPLYKQDDANHAEIVAATSDNARAKNWDVKYGDWNIRELDVPSNGNYDCSNTNPTPNMSKYITLTVRSGKDIGLNFKAPQANTPVRIVSGTNTQDITVGTNWYVASSYYNDNFTVTSDGTTMTIYGDITGFNCSKNRENLTSLDLSNNTQLTYLNCSKNRLTSLDVSNNTQLTRLDCSSNRLTSLDVSNNTQLTRLECSINQLTSLDVSNNTQLTRLECLYTYLTSLDLSNNTQLRELYCFYNELTSLDVRNNTQLNSLACHFNRLTSLDVRNNTQLTMLYCHGNRLTSLDVSNNTQLTMLECNNNQLTSLDVSNNTQLTRLECYNNPFTTEALNKLYCSLPDRQAEEKGEIFPLYKQDDTNHAEIVAATSNNARAKNWDVKYGNWNIRELDVPSNGNYDCSNTNPTPTPNLNMSKYITMNVLDYQKIKLNFKALAENTPVCIVMGNDTNKIKVGTDWFSADNSYTVLPETKQITIYGDVSHLDCSDNNGGITSLDASNNTQLTTLDCSNNQLTSLDLSNNYNLTKVNVSGNPFTTEAFDKLYCSLSEKAGTDKGICYVLNNANSPANSTVVMANSDNARAKNWEVKYLDNNNNVESKGKFVCANNIVLSVEKGQDIKIDFRAVADNTPIRILNGDEETNVTANSEWFGSNNTITAKSSRIVIYGDIEGLNCSDNGENIKHISVNDTLLQELYCAKNYLTNLYLSNSPKLADLDCSENQLTILDLKNNTQLQGVNCNSNKLTALDVTNSNRITYLFCWNNQLSEIDLSNNPRLAFLDCSRNMLTALNVSSNDELEELYCDNNKLPALNLTSNLKVKTVKCFNNPFSTEAVNILYCSLPAMKEEAGVCYTLNTTADEYYQEIIEGTSYNAKVKNWNVLYYNNGNATQDEIKSKDSVSCSSPRLNSYIKIAVVKGNPININFKGAIDKTGIRIVSGNTIIDTLVGTNWFSQNEKTNYTFTPEGNSVILFGDITHLNCANNGNKITAIDASNNRQLRELSCENNNISSIDINACKFLTKLTCQNNKIEELNLRNNTMLVDLACWNNKLTSLDLSYAPELKYLSCENNSIANLDLSYNTQLKKLWCFGNLFSTEAINNIYCSLPKTEGDAGECYTLNTTSDANHASAIKATSNIAREKNWVVKYYNNGNNKDNAQKDIPSNGKFSCSSSPDMTQYVNLKVKKGETIKLNFTALNPIRPLRIVNGDVVENMIKDTDITSKLLSITAETDNIRIYGGLTELICSDNYEKITAIDLSKNPEITTLYCQNNKLTSLVVINNKKLNKLNCANNEITSLVLDENKELSSLDCSMNGIKSLNLKNNTKLNTLNCSDNQLEYLSLSSCPKLTSVYCSNNKISSLELSGNNNIQFLSCNDNNISALDLRNNTKLKKVLCYNNAFSTEAMEDLYCALPTMETSKSEIFPLNTKNDASHAAIVAATADNARSKNWIVKYFNKASKEQEDVPSYGSYKCPTPPNANLSTFITLSVVKDSTIRFNFKAIEDNTMIKIVNGDKSQEIFAGKQWYDNGESSNLLLVAEDNTITIYGDIVEFSCYDNEGNITALDINNNTALKALSCHNNKLTTLDVSNNIQLTDLFCYRNNLTTLDVSKNVNLKNLFCFYNQLPMIDISNNANLRALYCYGNPFTTEEVNKLYCALPTITGTSGECFILDHITDENHEVIVAATSQNARAKNWRVLYNTTEIDVPSNGDYKCNSDVDESLLSGISVFPNPATSKVQIQLNESVNETLILVDLTGRAILTADVIGGKANIDVSNLTAGTYFLRIGNRVQKLTVK